MNSGKALWRVIVSLVLAVFWFAPEALANTEPKTDMTVATVSLTNGGEFDVRFCHPFLLNQGADDGFSYSVSATSGATATGMVWICFDDTEALRDGFTVRMKAGVFESGQSIPGLPGLNYSIPAENLTILNSRRPFQGQQGMTGDGFPIGDMAVSDGLAGKYYPLPGVTLQPSVPWSGTDLSEDPKVVYADAGVGTGDGTAVPVQEVDGTAVGFRVALDVPAGTHPGLYVSELTLTLTWDTP